MQALYLSYTIAGITCPLLTRPFMTSHLTEHTDFDQENPDLSLMTAFTHTTIVSTTVQKSLSYNVSTEDYNHLNNTLSEGRKSVIYLAFVITGVLTISSAIPYFIMTFFSKHKYDDRVQDTNVSNTVEKKSKLSKVRICIVVLFVCVVNLLYAGAEDTLGDFLITFSLYQLQWDETKSVLLMSLYWAASCLGGLIALFIVRPGTISRMTFCAFVMWVLSFLGATLCSHFHFNNLVWIFIPLSGMCMVIIIPNVISWTEMYVCNVSGKVSALIIMSTGTGIALNPPFIGHLMEKYSIIYFLYVLFIESLLCTLCFFCAYALLNFCFKYTLSSEKSRLKSRLSNSNYNQEIMLFEHERSARSHELEDDNALLSSDQVTTA